MSFIKVKLNVPIRYAKGVDLKIGTHILNRDEFISKWFMEGLIKSKKVEILEEIGVTYQASKKIRKPVKLPFDQLHVSDKPKVSVCCLTYNHQHCIKDALDGFLMQKTTFPFEVLIYDDFSKDRTPEIIKEYEKEYPGIVKPILGKENLFSKTKVLPFVSQLFSRTKGKYIAECDGDDFWTDPLKLQKQFDFMEEHFDYSLCYHDLLIYYMDKDRVDKAYLEKPPDYTEKELAGFEKYGKWLHPSTKMWRNVFHQNRKDFEICWGDNAVNVCLSLHGKCKYIEDIAPSIFRRFHKNNMWSSMNKQDTYKKTLEIFKRLYNFMEEKGIKEFAAIRKEILDKYIKDNESFLNKVVPRVRRFSRRTYSGSARRFV